MTKGSLAEIRIICRKIKTDLSNGINPIEARKSRKLETQLEQAQEIEHRKRESERCLNHVEQNKLKRIYQRHELKSEQKEAWRLLGDRLTLLLTSEHRDNVVVAHFPSEQGSDSVTIPQKNIIKALV
ncbi:MAG: hypothetical protein L3J88_08670 [Gammaproteobacteria bacterium]|nr:hypothetical protein [Gammaproteobacteria bacterium]MCF6363401.1 hypothetical protein [Gammaproteobacteria bacterium]